MSGHVKFFDESFLIEDEELLKTYNNIWTRVRNLIKKEFDCRPVYNEKYLKTKIKSYGKININFHDNGTPKEGYYCVCLNINRFCF